MTKGTKSQGRQGSLVEQDTVILRLAPVNSQLACTSRGNLELLERKHEYCLLRRGEISGWVVGLWCLTVYVILFGSNFMRISEIFFKPIIETLWGVTYFTYPAMILSDVVGYAFLATIAAPILSYYGRSIYGIGRSLRFNSLRLIGIVCTAIVPVSIMLVPFVYQEALDAIASYIYATGQGILYTVMFIPLGLRTIQLVLSVSLLLIASVFTAGAVEMKNRTGSSFFIVAIVLSLMSVFSIVLTLISALVMSGVNPLTAIIFLAGPNDLAILTLALTVISFGAGLRELGAHIGKGESGGSYPQHGT